MQASAELKTGTMSRAKPDEPVFVLRAQDESAPAVVAAWICYNINTAPAGKLREALECAIAMRQYPNRKQSD